MYTGEKHSMSSLIHLFPPQKILFSLGGSFLYYADRFKIYSAFCASHTKVPKVLVKGEWSCVVEGVREEPCAGRPAPGLLRLDNNEVQLLQWKPEGSVAMGERCR